MNPKKQELDMNVCKFIKKIIFQTYSQYFFMACIYVLKFSSNIINVRQLTTKQEMKSTGQLQIREVTRYWMVRVMDAPLIIVQVYNFYNILTAPSVLVNDFEYPGFQLH